MIGRATLTSQMLHAEQMRQTALPDEGICTMYYLRQKADAKKTIGAAEQRKLLYKVAPRSQSQAEQLVSEMLAVFECVDKFPTHYKKRLGQQLHFDEHGGAESFLQAWVAAHSKPLSENQYALMPDASPELIAEVSSLLRDDEYFSFLMRVRCMIPKPECSHGRSRFRQLVSRARCVIPRSQVGQDKVEEMSVYVVVRPAEDKKRACL